MEDAKKTRIRYGVTGRGLRVWYVSRLAESSPSANSRTAARGKPKKADGRGKPNASKASNDD